MVKRTRRTKEQMEQDRAPVESKEVTVEITVPNVRGENDAKYYFGQTPKITRELAEFLIARGQAK